MDVAEKKGRKKGKKENTWTKFNKYIIARRNERLSASPTFKLQTQKRSTSAQSVNTQDWRR
jgi:hypothetical protein